ncbi:hypothetical protein LHYA1_G008191 [Lachnellula hyalina]|uniref:Rhodopsin domain-containing protein n=1 Tax=Lachnellula hyalina TaxID=1316788 RepID=A0A8H8QUS5_9HELO|nr:uncharacterized protein LHYA1_G008191 [Lachnellula hyalina]TVY23073.1 hypothetical protein LHYA1_G008191 [Lachnellula hyalina]
MVQVPPRGDGIALLYTSIVLLALSWVTFVSRVGVRVWRRALGLDDFAMFIGILLFTVTACLCIVCSFYGSGQLAADLPASTKMKGTKLFFIAEMFYASGAAAIKCSIAVTLLRIADTRRNFVYCIWAIIIFSILSSVIFIIGVANICHPITTLWGETTTGSCNFKLNSDVSFFFSAIEITTDWALAILPAALLWKIQMKSRVKASVAGILGVAAFASCATIVRLRFLSLYSNPSEFMFSTGKIGLWSVIEEGTGIFAGSLPALRPLLNLRLLNGSGSHGGNSASAGQHFNKPRTGRHYASADVKLDTFQQLDDKDEDGDSQKHILKETHVTVTTQQSGSAGEWERNQVLGWKKNNYSAES